LEPNAFARATLFPPAGGSFGRALIGASPKRDPGFPGPAPRMPARRNAHDGDRHEEAGA